MKRCISLGSELILAFDIYTRASRISNIGWTESYEAQRCMAFHMDWNLPVQEEMRLALRSKIKLMISQAPVCQERNLKCNVVWLLV